MLRRSRRRPSARNARADELGWRVNQLQRPSPPPPAARAAPAGCAWGGVARRPAAEPGALPRPGREPERDAAGALEAAVLQPPGEEEARRPARLRGRPGGDQERLRAAVLVLHPGAVANARLVGAVEPLGDEPSRS